MPPNTDESRKSLLDKVKHYEGKLATLTAINGALQQENEDLRADLEAREPNADTETDMQELQQEFATRLAAADKQIATLKDKVETLKAQAAAASQGGSNSTARLQERENYIATLQEEGEGLSRKNGELEAVVRKLRASTRDLEQERERLQARYAALESQLAQEQERGSFSHQSATQQLEALEAELRDVRRDWAEDAARVRHEAAQSVSEARQEALQGNDRASHAAAERYAAVESSLHNERNAFQDAEQRWLTREEGLRREVGHLEEQVRAAEEAQADLMASSSHSTRPLLKQIEAMTASASAQQVTHAEVERRLTHKLRDAEASCRHAQEGEHAAQTRATTSEAALRAAQAGATQGAQKLADLTRQLAAERHKADTAQAAVQTAAERLQALQARHAQERTTQEGQLRELQEQLWEAQDKNRALLASKSSLASHSSADLNAAPAPGVAQSKADTMSAAQRVLLPVSRSSSHLLDSPPVVVTSNGAEAAQPAVPTPSGDSPASSQADRPQAGFDELISVLSRKGSGLKPQNGRVASTRQAGLEARLASAEAAAEAARAQLLEAAERAEAAQSHVDKYQQLQSDYQVQDQKLDMALELLGERNER
ncbi:hypothetical protein WJX73_002474 [Symbiochloris irregularis]|uniref:Uncharacterized protein n=1 Tax=Symbiochloris irregularis TaxID=706552 RepID=A0AAW1NSP1_9CHLO